MSESPNFAIGDKVVYPSHGVGQIIEIESQDIAGMQIEVYVISFPQDKMTLRVPVSRGAASGLRTLVTKKDISEVYNILNSKPKRGNKMWSRRAQEYETKINSGEIDAVAEVVRDLYKNVDNDRSYSERTIYESALGRLAAEIAVLEDISSQESTEKLVELLKEKLVAA
ncbi:MAG: CarD family transcriptional regulator [Rickettsiales bacterium]|nr:MAG: CarD family transcriptional regulator [Rickettsiales bacterium]